MAYPASSKVYPKDDGPINLNWHSLQYVGVLNRFYGSFLVLGGSSLLLGFLGSLVLGFLLGSLVLVSGLFVSSLLGSNGFLALLDFSDGLISKGLLVFRTSVFHFFNIVKSDTLDGSLFFKDFIS
jgi:hypothetical protein